jgi:hypothetical protein
MHIGRRGIQWQTTDSLTQPEFAAMPDGKVVDRREPADQLFDKGKDLLAQTVIEGFAVLEPAAIAYRQITGERLVKPGLLV